MIAYNKIKKGSHTDKSVYMSFVHLMDIRILQTYMHKIIMYVIA